MKTLLRAVSKSPTLKKSKRTSLLISGNVCDEYSPFHSDTNSIFSILESTSDFYARAKLLRAQTPLCERSVRFISDKSSSYADRFDENPTLDEPGAIEAYGYFLKLRSPSRATEVYELLLKAISKPKYIVDFYEYVKLLTNIEVVSLVDELRQLCLSAACSKELSILAHWILSKSSNMNAVKIGLLIYTSTCSNDEDAAQLIGLFLSYDEFVLYGIHRGFGLFHDENERFIRIGRRLGPFGCLLLTNFALPKLDLFQDYGTRVRYFILEKLLWEQPNLHCIAFVDETILKYLDVALILSKGLELNCRIMINCIKLLATNLYHSKTLIYDPHYKEIVEELKELLDIEFPEMFSDSEFNEYLDAYKQRLEFSMRIANEENKAYIATLLFE